MACNTNPSPSRTIIYQCQDTGMIVRETASGMWIMTNPRILTASYKSPSKSSNPAKWVRQVIKARKISADKWVARSKASHDEALKMQAFMEQLESKLP